MLSKLKYGLLNFVFNFHEVKKYKHYKHYKQYKHVHPQWNVKKVNLI